MASTNEARLLKRLARVVALHRGATTDGERVAAARARDRLVERIGRVRSDDPVARFCAEHLASLGVPGAPAPPPTPMPGPRDVLTALARWEAGEWSTDEIHQWAERLVDEVDLPDDPLDEAAFRAELLLQLAALHRVHLVPGDVPRIRRVLVERDWEGWFALLTTAAARRRRGVAGG